jgi:hypothetical protein
VNSTTIDPGKMMTEYNEPELTEEEIEERIKLIPDPPVTGRSWDKMTEEEHLLMRDYYDNTDLSALMEKGEWIFPSIEKGLERAARGEIKELDLDLDDDSLYPYQLEFDLGLIPIVWDENRRYSEVKFNMIFDHELDTAKYNELVDIICEALDEHFPCDFLSAKIRSGTDKELFPEAYDESEESDRTGQEEM